MEASLPTTSGELTEALEPTRRLRFGIKTAPQYTTYDDILRIWREADQIPVFEHAWVFDHLIAVGDDRSGPCLEGWTLLSALAAATERLRVGVMVTSNTFRHPALLAKMAATVDQMSHGRLDFGIGAGWNAREHASTGIPLYPPSERIDRLAEACELISTSSGSLSFLKAVRPPMEARGGANTLWLALERRALG